MSKSKTMTLAPERGREENVELTLRAVVMRREGFSYEEIAQRLRCSPWDARQITSIAYGRLATETADELRAEVEGRLDDVLRRLYVDVNLAPDQATRNGVYTLILKTEAQRTRLLGLEIPAGTPDAGPDA
ncbi:hypothetical protein [Clavibacter zhangzhiyongii]|uniref:hypothetical protein n=1 Tax=Clavibacter zhangzhiyongii TaxID=2768071 RepID=UPI0039E1464B